MPRRPSVADEAAYPPYQRRPSLAASDVETTTPAGHGARAPYRTGSAVGAGGGEGRYLQAAQQIELTQEDKQVRGFSLSSTRCRAARTAD